MKINLISTDPTSYIIHECGFQVSVHDFFSRDQIAEMINIHDDYLMSVKNAYMFGSALRNFFLIKDVSPLLKNSSLKIQRATGKTVMKMYLVKKKMHSDP